jgi:prolyl oligopeptidase
LLRRRALVGAVIAQFFYVGAQVGIWSFFIDFVKDVMPQISERNAANLLSTSLFMFMVGRFSGALIMTWIRPATLLGVYAIANIRGGGEFGEEWHAAGSLTRKQNVFDDFIAAAEWLIDQHYTSPQRLAIQGGSNGGLLVGAVMTQRPELFGAALPEVGVMDMLRFQKFTIGWAWTSDYGSSDDAEQFKYLRAYSPLQNIKPGTCYPPTLAFTADHDDRVVPGHTFKFVATLQAAQSCANPVLVRIQTKAGHGGGKPTTKLIDEAADRFSFLVKELHIRPVLQ